MISARIWAFRCAAVACLVPVLYHATALCSPGTFARVLRACPTCPTYPHGYPKGRHLFFMGLGITFAVLFLWERRPRWLVWPFALVCLQQFHGRGERLWAMWRAGVSLHPHDVVTPFGIGLTAVLALLVLDWRERKGC